MEEDNDDLWWALRGGIGGTFGIVTEYRYILHPHPPNIIRAVTFYPLSDRVAIPVIKEFSSWIVHTADNNVGGSLSLDSGSPLIPVNYLQFYLYYFGSWEEGWPILEPIVNFRRNTQLIRIVENSTEYVEFAKDYPEAENQYFHYIDSRHFMEEDILSDSFAETILSQKEYNVDIFNSLTINGGENIYISNV